ncbi:TPA: ATP-binding protein [Escherichia coli]|uniref:IncI1-type conjugal transfer protein TraU n=1 Tax=Escherichia coli TaxID=562 RepID=UPI0012CC77D3|nr:IncI1-type conjugal transfer protein TraU [Escherichia coli]EBX4517571.1 ATP-binding protein [Salmonella enterica subsp. enterica serovar Java]HAJ2961516.1 ATP-binding protein [Escherichia coli]HAJ2966114.1 ATP-binding protein [Escherichia coli]HBD4577960.1 IncI1-type conjugal transfer protein TraU [Shigella sonnei]
MNINRLIFTIEDCLNTLSRFSVASSFVEYCDLRTVIGLDRQDRERRPWLNSPYIAATKRGEYISVFEVSGAFREMDEASDQTGPGSLESLITSMSDSLNTAYKNSGHKISFVFERDPDMGKEEIEDMVAPQKRSLANTGIQLQDVVDEKVTTLSPWLVRERCWLAIWSGPDLISNSDRTAHDELVRRLAERVPKARFAQSPWQWALSALKIRHEAFLDNVEQALRHSSDGLILRLLDIHEVGREIRRQTERHSTPRNWQPHLPEDAQPAGYRWTDDESVLHAPSLHLQLFNTQVTTQGNLVQAGGLWHGMVSITLPPQNLQTFNELVRAVPRAVPWRIRMDLMPGGMKALNLKKTLLTYSSFISAVRPMYESVMTLAATDEKEPVCIMTIMASTWGKTREICTRNQAILKSAIEGWGVCGTTTTFGDPRRAWVNTILAASGGSGPVPLYPPLSHAISLFPLNRAGSVWRGKGNLMLHTEDGSAFEVGLASSQQNKHTELAPGDPGLGKSVLINTLSEIQISSAQKNLPFIAYIDKGYSAQGLVQLIRDSLPPERKDEAVGIILSNDPEYTRNLFDVMYGAKKPITPEKNFMSSVLCALCVDTGTGQPCNPGDTRQIINQLIELAFKEYGENNPRLYRASTEELVDSALQDSGLYEKHDAAWWARSTWFEVRDMLHNAGYIMAAQRAHYQAMPQLPEVSSMLGHTSLRDVFGTVQRDGSNELLLDYIRRALEQGHNDYPMISGYTRFMINPETRVIAVDLNNVAGDKTPAGRLKTGIMYLLAGQIAGGDFTLPQYRDEVLKQLPREYHEIALKRINQLDQEVKTKVYDELHNARGIDFIWENLDTQEREQRKFAIRTVLSTQYLRDYPESVLKSANTLWLLRYKPEDIPVLRDNFNVPEFMLKRFLKMPEGPAPDGSGVPVLGVFRVKSGTLARILKFTVGPLELWALNSSPKDSALRKTLTNKLGSVRARKILAENFPRGSATSLIEHRAGQHNSDNVIEDLASELIRKQGYNL